MVTMILLIIAVVFGLFYLLVYGLVNAFWLVDLAVFALLIYGIYRLVIFFRDRR